MGKFDTIIKLIRKGDVSLFIGAGFSIKAGAPSVHTIIESLLEDLTEEQKEELSNKPQLDEVSSLYELYFSRDQLTQKLKSIFTFTPNDLSDQQALIKIPQIKTIFTTNYETLIEDEYHDRCNVIVQDTDLINLDSRYPSIYKIHGDFSHPDKIIISQNDYTEFYTKHSQQVLWQKICSELVQRHILFIGYSLSDSNIKYIIDNLRNQVGDTAKEAYLIAPSIHQSNKTYLHKKHITYIDATAEELFQELLPAIRDNAIKDFREHTISAEDCKAILSLHDLQPTIELYPQTLPNRIYSVKSISGKPLHKEIKLAFPTMTKGDDFMSQFPTMYDDFGLPYKDINFAKLQYNINDVRFSTEEDITKFIMYPARKDVAVIFSNRSKRIFCVKGFMYRDFDTPKVIIIVEMEIGTFKITLPIQTNELQKEVFMNFNVTFRDKYKDNYRAIEEGKLLYDIVQGKRIIINITNEDGVSIEKVLNEKALDSNLITALHKRLQYYQYIQKIEHKLNFHFQEYTNYINSKDFLAANIIYSYLYKKIALIDNLPNIQYKLTTTDDFILSENENRYAILLEHPNVQFMLNGKNFIIPYYIMLKENCKIISAQKINQGTEITYIDESEKSKIIPRDIPFNLSQHKAL